jgi:hypothetical protein
MLSKDFMQDMSNLTANMAQDKQLAYHKKHIQVLWNHIERLERAIDVEDGQATIKLGEAAVILKKDGTVIIKGRNVRIESWGRIDIKSAGEVVIKGEKISQN